MLCKKYGVDTQNFAIDRIPDELKNKEPKDIKAELGKTQKAFKEITARVSDELYRQRAERSKEQERYVSKALPVGNAYLFSNRQVHHSRVFRNTQPDNYSDEQNPRSCPRLCKLCRFPPFGRYPYGRIIRPDRFRPPNRRR